MRVGIDVRAVQFVSGLRGTGRYVYNVIQGLLDLDRGTEYVLLSYKDLPFPDSLKEFVGRASVGEIDAPPALNSRYPWFQSTPKLRSMRVLPGIHWRSYYKNQARSIAETVRRERLDLLHLTSPFDLHTGPATGCPINTVYTFLDAIPLVCADSFYDLWSIPTKRLYNLQKQAFQSATRIVGISDNSCQDAIRHYGVDPKRVSRIYCALQPGLEKPIDEPAIAEVREAFGLKDRYFAFCSVADRHKGVETLLRALIELRDTSGSPFQLAIIGLQPKDIHESIKSFCFDLGLDGRDVIVTGFVSDEILRTLVKGAIALMSPSRYEGFGYSAGQALAIGTPVIASNSSSLPEVVGDAGLLVDPDSVSDLSEAMNRVASDGVFREACIGRGHQQAKLFAPGPLAEQMWELYNLAAN